MTNIEPSSHGIVVDHKESDVRYAISDRNFNPKVHTRVRDLKPGESVIGYRPRRKGSREEPGNTVPENGTAGDPSDGSATASETQGAAPAPTQTEGSAPAGTKGK